MNQRAYISQLAQRYGLDPAAVLSIASVEGGFHGAVGDNGTSFGPFQMHEGGALPQGRGNNWANSRQGINYAIQHIASVAKGLHGKQAISAISSRFERPADVAGEIAKASGRYGSFSGGGGLGGGMGLTQAPGPGNGQSGAPGGMGAGSSRKAALMALIQSNNSFISGGEPTDPMQTLEMMQQMRQPGQQHPRGGSPMGAPAGPAPQQYNGNFNFLGDTQGEKGSFLHKLTAAARAAGATKIRVTSGYRSPSHNAAVGGVSHSNHTTGDAMDGEAYVPGKGWIPLGVALQAVANRYGLRSGNVPGFYNGNPDPVHVDDGHNVR